MSEEKQKVLIGGKASDGLGHAEFKPYRMREKDFKELEKKYIDRESLVGDYQEEIEELENKLIKLRRAAGEMIIVAKATFIVWQDKFDKNTVNAFNKAEKELLEALEETIEYKDLLPQDKDK